MIGAALRVLRQIVIGSDSDPQAGFGQSMADDLRFAIRFRRCRRFSPEWRPPSEEEASRFNADPIVGRFGDMTIVLAYVDGRQWIVRERDWYGWPDPPRYTFFALNDDQSVWAARDFDWWPQAWASRPA